MVTNGNARTGYLVQPPEWGESRICLIGSPLPGGSHTPVCEPFFVVETLKSVRR